MRTNGYILLKIKVGGGIDPTTGYPAPPTVSWSEPIRCYYRANKYNQIGMVNDMAFTSAQYCISVERTEIQSEVLRLVADNGRELGEFSIMHIEDNEMKGRITITV